MNDPRVRKKISRQISIASSELLSVIGPPSTSLGYNIMNTRIVKARIEKKRISG
jgi:hypothetical protein